MSPPGRLATALASHTNGEPQGTSQIKRAANYRKLPCSIWFCWRGTGHPSQACQQYMPLLRAGKHPLSFPASTDRAFLAPNLPGFNRGTVSINPPAGTAGAEEAGSQVSFHKATNLSAIKAATKEDSNIIDIFFTYIYVYSYQQGAEDSILAETRGQGALLRGQEPGSPSCPWGQESLLFLLYLATVLPNQARIPARISLTSCLK